MRSVETGNGIAIAIVIPRVIAVPLGMLILALGIYFSAGIAIGMLATGGARSCGPLGPSIELRAGR